MRPWIGILALLGAASVSVSQAEMIVLGQSGGVAITVAGQNDSQTLPPHEPGSVFVELGVNDGQGEYGVASLTSSFSPVEIELSILADVGSRGTPSLASAGITMEFFLTEPLLYGVKRRAAEAAGSGYLGNSNYVHLSDSSGLIWMMVAGGGEFCNYDHPSGGELCSSSLLPAGEYALTLSAFAFYPENCGSCHGFTYFASADVRLTFAPDVDADGLFDPDDNCPTVANPGQGDFDEDLEGDMCDLDDGTIHFVWISPGRVRWQEESGYDTWNLYRGDLAFLVDTGVYTQSPGSNPLASQWCNRTSLYYNGTPDLEPGQTAFYLVSGNTAGVEGDLGDSATGPRANHTPCN